MKVKFLDLLLIEVIIQIKNHFFFFDFLLGILIYFIILLFV